ncbi:portal protein [Gordonia phage Kroos]|uniref:Portal protein n=1 Tax=Gordonia phage Kroos TaxID=2483671 RepID=A0A3G3M976_9CAUD|nr:portal protein [Gordonia phage Kroos]AYR02991.1 portal protein [Gordonia phage Kroos]
MPRSDSRALAIVRRHAEPSPLSLIAAAKRAAPTAQTITSYEVDRRRPSVRRENSITAAVEPLHGSQQMASGRPQRRKRRRQAERWQSEVWELRRESPELRFLADRKARAAGQCRLFIGHMPPGHRGEPLRVTEGIAAELSNQLFGNQADVEQKIRRYAQHIEYNGESILNARDNPERPGELLWSMHSSRELIGSQAGQYQITDGVTPRKVDDELEILARSWIPDPEMSAYADAPVRSLLPVLRELVQMTKYVGAQIDSRLASGGGLLFVSDDVEIFDAEGKQLGFADELHSYMLTAVEDRGSSESLAPIVARVPHKDGRSLADIAHLMTFGEALDPHMHERRAEAIQRIALGMDSDPMVLNGGGSANHWSMWAVDEGEQKFGVAPVVTSMCHTLSTELVQPLLAAQNVNNAHEFVAWFDDDELKLRPDRSKDAQLLHERGILSDEVALTESGFGKSDMPSQGEVTARWLRDNAIALMGMNPAVMAPILEGMGVKLPPAPAAPIEVQGPADQQRPAVAAAPDNSPPDTLNDPPPAARIDPEAL